MHYVTTHTLTFRIDNWIATQYNKPSVSTLVTYLIGIDIKIVTLQCMLSAIMFFIYYFLLDIGYIIVNS